MIRILLRFRTLYLVEKVDKGKLVEIGRDNVAPNALEEARQDEDVVKDGQADEQPVKRGREPLGQQEGNGDPVGDEPGDPDDHLEDALGPPRELLVEGQLSVGGARAVVVVRRNAHRGGVDRRY